MTYWRTPRMATSAKQSSVYRPRMIKTALNGDLTARVADSAKAIIALLVSLAGSVKRGAIGSSRIFGAASSI